MVLLVEVDGVVRGKGQTMTQTELLDAIRRYRSDKGHQYAIVRLGIFGSAARNRMTGASDIL